MEAARFIFWESVKVIGLVLLGLVAIKSVAALAVRQKWMKTALYGLILGLAITGAWQVGNDVAAEVYMWTADSSLARGDLAKAYANALQAVSLRPHSLSYWRSLLEAKMRLQQFQSVLDDQPAVRAVSGGELDEADEYRFALCSFFLGQNDNVVATTLRLIRRNPSYAAPYVLQGWAYLSEQRYPEAQQSFLAVLQMFPTNQAAVEGLARAFFLGGERAQARAVLEQTTKYPFLPAERQRFEALKGLYDQ